MRPFSQITEEEKNFVAQEYIKGKLKCPQIGKILNTGAWTIEKILKEKGVERIANKLSKAQKEEMVKSYTSTSNTLAYYGKKYGTTPENVSSILKKRGIKPRTGKGKNRIFNFNQDYFKKVDTEAKAYFLGLLYADGCVREGKIAIGLQKRDKNILKIFQKQLNHKGKLKIRKLNKKNKNHQDSYLLLLCSVKMVNDLVKLGCVPNKSLILKFPTEEQVPKNLLYDFIRGYIDGDGCIGIYYTNIYNKRRMMCCSVVSTYQFLNELKIKLNEIGVKSYITTSHENGVTRTLAIGSNKSLRIILDKLYSNANFYIKRKRDKAIEIVNSENLPRGYWKNKDRLFNQNLS